MDKSQLPRLSAGRRIILVFAVSALAGILLVGAALMHSLDRAALAQSRTYLESQSGTLARQCESEIAEAQRDLLFLSKMPAFQQLPYVDQIDPAINGVPENVDVEKRQLLTLTLNRTERFSVLYVLRPNADIYMVEPFGLQPKLTKNNLADTPYYQEAVRTKHVVVSDSFIGADGVPAVVVLAPILADSGDVTGYLGGAFHLTRLSQLVSKERITPYDAGFMVDRKGYLIAHTDVGLLKEGVRERFVQHPLVSRFLAAQGGKTGADEGAVLFDEYLDSANGKPYLAAFIPLRSGWGLALLRERDSVMGEVQPVIWRITGLAALLFLVVSGIGVAIAQRIGKRWEAAERALRAGEERFRTVAESVSDVIYEWDLKDKMNWHGDVDRLLGYPAGGFPRTQGGWVAALHPEDKDRVRAAVDGQLKGAAPYNVEYRVAGKDGGWRWWSSRGTVLRDERGEPKGWLGAVTDITERKQVENALHAAERAEDTLRRNALELEVRNRIAKAFLTVADDEMYAEVLAIILEAMGSKYGVFGYLDEKGGLVVPTMTRTIWDQCQVPDKTFVFPRETWGDSSWPRAIREKRTIRLNELSAKTPEGHIPMERHISMPLIHQGEVVGLVQVANKETDYTDEDAALLETIGWTIAPVLEARLNRERQEAARKRALADLERSNKELEQFAYVASHDLQEPLRMVSSYTQLLAQRYEGQLDEKAKKYIDYAVDGAIRMQRLINDLLTYSRVGTRGKPLEPTDSHAVLGEAQRNLAAMIEENPGHCHQRRSADGARRRPATRAGVPEPHRQRHQVPGQGPPARTRVRPGAGRGMGLRGQRQRHRH